MLKKIRSKSVLSTVFFFLASVILVTGFAPFALADPPPPPGLPPTTIPNPLTTATFTDLLDRVLNILLVFAGLGVITLIGYSALLFMTSGGSAIAATKAREVLKWALIGFIVIIGAKLIVNILSSIIGV